MCLKLVGRIHGLIRLLLVDDEKDNLLLFKDILNDVGFVVDAYYDHVQALLEYKPNDYDLLILDYLMPQLNGIELFKKIKEMDRSPKVMLLTASHEQLETENFGQSEFKVVRKPVKITDFLQEINAIFANDKSQQIINTTA